MTQKLVLWRFLMGMRSVNSCHFKLMTFPFPILPEVLEKVEIAQQEGNTTSRECEGVK